MKNLLKIFFALGIILILAASRQVIAQSCSSIPASQKAMGEITFPISITTDGNYIINLRMKAMDSQKNSLYLTVDNGCPIIAGDSTSVSSSNWTYVDFKNGDINSKLSFNLSKGNHVIVVTGREDGVKLDRIALKPTGSSCTLSGKDDICSVSVTPTRTPTPSIPGTTLTPTRTQSLTPTVTIQNPTPTKSVTPSPTRRPTATPIRSTPVPTRTPTPTLTPTRTPSPTPQPGSIVLSFDVYLAGIGNAGDSVRRNTEGNKNPLNKSRNIEVRISDPLPNDSLNLPEQTKIGAVNYDENSGSFKGTINLGTQIPEGEYSVNALISGYLVQVLNNSSQLRKDQELNFNNHLFPAGDTNSDDALDILDYNNILSCFNEKFQTSICFYKTSDLDDNGKVDGIDYNLFFRETTWWTQSKNN